MHVGIVINPRAGPKRRFTAEARVHLARAALREQAIEGDARLTTGRGTARTVARALVDAGATHLVAWGGDGTVNEVASEAIARDVSLGIVPGGTGNGLARELALEHRPAAALHTALAGHERVIDAGEIDGRMFVNVAGMGFDAWLAEVFNALTYRRKAAYFTSGLRELRAYQPATYTVRTAHTSFRMAAFSPAVANGRQYGSGAVIAPDARLDDGRLQIVCVPPAPTWALLWQARRLFTGSVDRMPGIRIISTDGAEIEADQPSVTFHVDGEVCTGGWQMRVRVLPHALRVRVPKSEQV